MQYVCVFKTFIVLLLYYQYYYITLPKQFYNEICSVLDQGAMDLHCQQVVEPPHSLPPLSTRSWSRPQQVASLHLRLTLSRATAQHLTLVSNTISSAHYTSALF